MLLFCILLSFEWFVDSGTWTERSLIHAFVFDVGISHQNASYAISLGPPDEDQTLKSTDLGLTWNIVGIRNGVFDLACSSISYSNAVVIDLIGDAWYTFDGGNNWNYSTSFVPGCQSISHSRNGTLYGAAAGVGIHISNDHGITWKYYKIPSVVQGAARYSALPTDKIWYVSTGEFMTPHTTTRPPNYQSVYTLKHSFSSNFRLYQHRNGSYHFRNYEGNLHDNFTGMLGQIWKTMDGGNTWNLTYEDENRFYFNAIDCCDKEVCYAVAEGNVGGGSQEPGSRIFQTFDGGNNWNQTYYNNETSSSLMAVHCISKYEAYAGGSVNFFKGIFLHTVNGGINWAQHFVPSPIMFMDMTNDGKYGIASGLEAADGGAVMYAYF